ncbi:uncharacterized protein [Nicotiana sylvestris]|uniref:uncharacterized protein n=1 Tax=Nicotiana sylvestris TaxID=4096 RepID=UPI00388C3A92
MNYYKEEHNRDLISWCSLIEVQVNNSWNANAKSDCMHTVHATVQQIVRQSFFIEKNRVSRSDITIVINKLVRKILSVLPGSWESKVNAITEAKDLQTLTMDELIGNIKIYEMKRKKDSKRREPKKEKNLVLKAENSDSSEEDCDMAYLTKSQGILIKNCPLLKQEQYKQNPDKAAKKNPVPDKRFSQKSAADNIVKQTLAAWGDSSSESEMEPDVENSSMMSDDDEKDENDEVNFRDVQKNLKSYSSKKLRSLANVLIDAYYSLDNDKKILTIELGEAEQSRDDLVVCVVDLNKTIANLEKEKEVLNEKINSVENERDGLMGLNLEHRTVSLGKGKEVDSKTHIKLEKELNDVKTSLNGELEKNRQLQAEFEKVKIDLEKSLKWTWSSDDVIAMYFNNSGNK